MAAKKKVEDRSYEELKAELAAGRIGNLYIFHGEEVYLRDHHLREMKGMLLTGGVDDFNYHTMSGKDFSIHRLQELVDAMPMMSERTMVVVSDYDIYKGDKEAMADLLSDLPEYVCLIFVYDVIEYKPDNRVKLAKVVKERGKVVDFRRQEREKLVNWVARRFKAMDHDISSEDARYLIEQCGDLMTNLISEIGKVGSYAKERRVKRQDIDAVASPQLDVVVFGLTEAISAGNFDRAFSVMGDLLHSPEEGPIGILAVLGSQLRKLYAARLAKEHRKGKQWVMEMWGIQWDSVGDRLMRSAERFSLDWCRRAVRRCQETDLAMKSTGADPAQLLTGLLLELSAKKTA